MYNYIYPYQLWLDASQLVEQATTDRRGMEHISDCAFQACRRGCTVDLVVTVQVSDGDCCKGVTAWHKEWFVCDFGLAVGTWTLYGVQFENFEAGFGYLTRGPDMHVCRKPARAPSSFKVLRETCCGLGGFSTGASYLNFQTCAFNDRSPLACQAIALNGGRVFPGDIADRSVVLAMHLSAPDVSGFLTAGFPCQPYSQLGDRGGLAEARGQTLVHILRAAWLWQVEGLVLENVPEVAQHADTMRLLQAFAAMAGFQTSSTVLELGDKWPSRRRRWWLVMLPADMPEFSLRAWQPDEKLPIIADVIPHWPVWPKSDEDDLLWSPEEEAKYGDLAYGQDVRRYCQHSQAATVVHTLGNALRPCPCGCRKFPFSEARLRAGGLRGVGVLSHDRQSIRFPHPCEVGLLNALPPCFKHVSPPRFALCLIGQVASPLQFLWVFACIQEWLDTVWALPRRTDPALAIDGFRHMLLQQRQDFWILPSMFGKRELEISQNGTSLAILASTPVCCSQLLAAEVDILGIQAALRLRQGDRLLDSGALLHVGTRYEVCEIATEGTSQELPERPDAPETTDVAVWWGLCALGAGAGSKHAQLPAMCAACILTGAKKGLLHRLPGLTLPTADACIFVPFTAAGHWTLLVLTRAGDGIRARSYDGLPGRNRDDARILAEGIAKLMMVSVAPLEEVTLELQTQPGDCGALLLAHAAFVIQGDGVPFGECLGWAKQFLTCLPLHPFALTGKGGLSADQQQALRDLLINKGVPDQQVAERIDAACTKLGAGHICQALQSKQPWTSLKAVASRPGNMFRWVLTTELQAHIERKAAASFGTSVPGGKHKKVKGKGTKPSVPALSLDPRHLQMSAGSFSSAGGQPLAQLDFSEVQQHATGICFCSVMQALPFLQQYKAISVDALALLTTSAVPGELIGLAPASTLRYPAVYAPTGEAVLVSGHLIQLGDEAAQLTPASIAEVDQIETCVVRIQVYRDQCSIPWDRIVEAPMKAITLQHPELTLCKNSGCRQDPSCPRFHPAVEEGSLDQLFLDLWGRQYQKLQGGKAGPDDAQVFQVYVRVPATALHHLHRMNVPGVFMEPRAPDGVGPHPAYAAIWLPGADADTARHTLRTCEKAIAIARIGCAADKSFAKRPTLHGSEPLVQGSTAPSSLGSSYWICLMVRAEAQMGDAFGRLAARSCTRVIRTWPSPSGMASAGGSSKVPTTHAEPSADPRSGCKGLARHCQPCKI